MKTILNLKSVALALVAVCALFASNKSEAQAPWQFCGYEGQVCSVPNGVYDLAFGTGGAWTYIYGAQVPGQFICRTQTFGPDPAPGYQKSCFVRTGAPPPPPPPPPTTRWAFCVAEGDICRLRQPTTVRYGVPGAYIYLYNQVGFACTNTVFGGDPAPGVRKQCDYQF